MSLFLNIHSVQERNALLINRIDSKKYLHIKDGHESSIILQILIGKWNWKIGKIRIQKLHPVQMRFS